MCVCLCVHRNISKTNIFPRLSGWSEDFLTKNSEKWLIISLSLSKKVLSGWVNTNSNKMPSVGKNHNSKNSTSNKVGFLCLSPVCYTVNTDWTDLTMVQFTIALFYDYAKHLQFWIWIFSGAGRMQSNTVTIPRELQHHKMNNQFATACCDANLCLVG